MRRTKYGKPLWDEGVDPVAFREAMVAWERRTWAESVADGCAHSHAMADWQVRLQVEAAANDTGLLFKFVYRCACAPEPGYLGPRGGGPWWREDEQPSPADNSAVCNGPRDLREALEAAHGAARAARRAAKGAPGDPRLAGAAAAARTAYQAARARWRAEVSEEAKRQMARDEAARP